MQPKPPSADGTKKQPHPLRVAHLDSTFNSTARGLDSTRSRSTVKTPRKEVTVVGSGTCGLGGQAKKLHDDVQQQAYDEWLQKKKDKESIRRAEEQEARRQQKPLSGKDRLVLRKYATVSRHYENEDRQKKMALEFHRQKEEMKQEHKRQRDDEERFVRDYSTDNVASARAQIHSSREHRQQLEDLRLPSLQGLRTGIAEEKKRWGQMQEEQKEYNYTVRSGRRQYVLDMKAISSVNIEEDKEEKLSEVAQQRQWLHDKETQRKRDHDEERERLAAVAKESRIQQRNAMTKVKYDQYIQTKKYVDGRMKEYHDMEIPIQASREEWLRQMQEVVKQRKAAEKKEKTDNLAFRKAMADDMRADTTRHRYELQRERDVILSEKRALHDEGRRAMTARREKQRERYSSCSPVRSGVGSGLLVC